MPLGAAVASVEKIRPSWIEDEFRHSVIAFGGGALLSAIALVLVPNGIANLKPLSATIYFCGGGFAFMGLNILLYKMNTPASQLAAMLSDFIPESMALGAAFAIGGSSAFLLCVLMALQNLPEGFNAYRELSESSSYSRLKIITMFHTLDQLSGLAYRTKYIDVPFHKDIFPCRYAQGEPIRPARHGRERLRVVLRLAGAV